MIDKRRRRGLAWFVGALAVATPAAVARQSPAPPRHARSAAPLRVQLRPRLVPGTVKRYQIKFQTTSETSHGGDVQDPQGPAHLVVTWDATMRMEVLGSDSPASPAVSVPGTIRLRTTYERSSATVQSDTPDPQAEAIEQQYAKLEGGSIEVTLAADGSVSAVRGLEGILTDEKARSAAEQWIKQVSGGLGTPARGIVPGQIWTSDEPADSLPLAGMRWHTVSTYLKDEPCRPADSTGSTSGGTAAAPSPEGETCAVILTRLSLVTERKMKDPTPQSYRQNGMHTAGRWSSSGESLSYVSLRNGWVVNVTQNGSEQMDMTFTNASGAVIQYAGTVGTRSQLTMLPTEAAAQ